MIQDKTGQRLALQNLINSYCFEVRRGKVITVDNQDSSYQQVSGGKPVMELKLAPLDITVIVPIEKESKLGQHRYADTPYVQKDGEWIQLSPVSIANLLLEDIAYEHKDQDKLDPKGVLKRWIQSYQGLELILEERMDEIDDIVELELDFIETEQNLIYGHAMHPTPKGREGFHPDEWGKYAPETGSKVKLAYWLVDASNIVEEYVDGDSICAELVEHLKPTMSTYQRKLVEENSSYKLLPLHPWQAKFLQNKEWYQTLLEQGKLFNLGEFGWELHPTTSVRTLAAFDAKWMFKVSISVAITNSVRINLPKECKRGLYACKIWRSEYGNRLNTNYPTVGVLNDPAWIALTVNGKIVDETICILRDNPFDEDMQVTNIASLCQDHPSRVTNRFNTIFKAISRRSNQELVDVAHDWFDKYLEVAFVPFIDLYYEQGIGFEVHQQNSLLELENHYPARVWARDNQGFGYIAEYAMDLIDNNPELMHEAECVVPEDFADERVGYYLVGNTMFGLITAIARTGLVTEDELLSKFHACLTELNEKYPNRSLFDLLLRSQTLPFKGNLLTRMYALDELTAPVESQSIYVDIPNPIKPLQK